MCCWLFEFVLQKSLFRDAESRNQGGRLYPIDKISVCLYPDRPDSESENGTESFSFHFLLSLKKSPHRVFAVFTSTDGPKEPGVSKIHDFLPKKAQCFFLVVGLKKPWGSPACCPAGTCVRTKLEIVYGTFWWETRDSGGFNLETPTVSF